MTGFLFPARVNYDDIDSEQRLTMKGLMGMLQETAITDSSRCGYGLKEVHSKNRAWLLAQWHIRMTGVAKWAEPVQIETWVQSMERVKCTRNFSVTNQKGEQIAAAESIWTLVDVEKGHPVKLTPEIISCYPCIEKAVFTEKLPKIPRCTPQAPDYCCTITGRDLDTNRHVNNRIYVELAREALPENHRYTEFSELAVHYHRQLFLGAKVQCCYRWENGLHVVDILEEGDTHCCAQVIFYPV